MALVCNIDRRGRAFRLAVGIACALAGMGAVTLAWWLHSLILLVVGIAFVLAGALCIWQGAKGYCLVRALGIRMPI